MTRNGAGLIALLILQALCLPRSHGAESGGSAFSEELEKQEQIYRSRGEQRPEGYVIDRNLLSYTYTLPDEFERTLAKLGPKDRWLDIGAGKGQAVLDYFAGRFDAKYAALGGRSDGKAQVVAMSIEDRRTPVWYEAAKSLGADKIQYVCNRRLREYAPEELGTFQVITDVIGGFSYTSNLSLFTERVLALLERGGSFFTVLQDVHAEKATNKPYYDGSPFLTEIARSDGSEVKVCAWLKSISCVEVTCEFRPDWQPPIEVFQVRKVCDGVKVPALVTIHFTSGTPPERGFRLKD